MEQNLLENLVKAAEKRQEKELEYLLAEKEFEEALAAWKRAAAN